MILVSLNVQGLGNESKRATLKHFLGSLKPGILLLQETMTDGDSSCDYFFKFKPYWFVSVGDSNGLSGGTLVAQNPPVENLSSYITLSGIMVEGHLFGYAK